MLSKNIIKQKTTLVFACFIKMLSKIKFHTTLLFLLLQIVGIKTIIGQDTSSLHIIQTHERNSYSSVNYLGKSATILPATLIVYGLLKPIIPGIRNIDNQLMQQVKNSYPNDHTVADDYLMWVPSSSVYLLDAFSIKTTHSFKEHLILDAGSIIIAGGIGYVMRKISGNIEVYKMNGTKFPSGHTVNVFRGAEIFHQELKETNKLLSYTGYLIAVVVGTLRIYNKAHYLTEVIAGAGLGIMSTKLTYWTFNKIKYKKVNQRENKIVL